MPLPATAHEFLTWSAAQIEPYIQELIDRPLTADTISDWLRDWKHLACLFQESMARLDIATDLNTQDDAARERQSRYRQEIHPLSFRMDQALDRRLIENVAILPADLLPAVKRLKSYDHIYSEAAMPLLNEEAELAGQYNRIRGAQTVEWQGETRTLRQMQPALAHPDREYREKAWRLAQTRRLQDKDALNALWQKLLAQRQKIAHQAGYENYLAYKFYEYARFDYTPDDNRRFHDILEKTLVPAVARLHQSKKQQLKLDRLRPWDSEVDPQARPPLRPFETTDELIEKSARVFQRIDPEFAAYFDHMCRNNLLDIGDNPGKGAYGGFTRVFALTGTFMSLKVNHTHGDMQNLMHEMGHAFCHQAHLNLPYLQQLGTPMDFSEAPSMVMEMLSMPFWDEFYTPEDLRRAQNDYWRGALSYWIHLPIADIFQFEAYLNPESAVNPDWCDATWGALIQRFYPEMDWSGLERERDAGWQYEMSIFMMPFHGMNYGYGQMAAANLCAIFRRRWQNTNRQFR